MDREQTAKAAVAAGIFVMVIVAVFVFWFALPGMQSGQVAYAQDEEAGGEAGAAPPGGEMGAPPGGPGGGGGPPGMGGGMPGMGGEMGGGMPGMGGGGGGGAPASSAPPGPPIEPSRANPFVPVDLPDPEPTYETPKTTYGPDWDQLPVGYMNRYPQPQIPPGPANPLPPNPSASADLVRVSSVVWPSEDIGAGSAGRAFATWEDHTGRTRIMKPGQTLHVVDPVSETGQSWRVVSIEPDVVVLQNPRTGERVRKYIEPRSRAERRAQGANALAEDIRAKQEAGMIIRGEARDLPGGTAQGAGGAGMGMGMGMGGEMEMGPDMGGGMPGMPGAPGAP